MRARLLAGMHAMPRFMNAFTRLNSKLIGILNNVNRISSLFCSLETIQNEQTSLHLW